MKRSFKKLIVLILVVCLMPLYGCGGAEGNNNMPMGRYVEDVLELPESAGRIIGQMAGEDGTLDIYTQNDGRISLYRTKDGESWQRQALEWQLPESQSPLNMAYNDSGDIFVATLEVNQQPPQQQQPQQGLQLAAPGGQGATMRLYKTAGGALEEVNVNWATGAGPGGGMVMMSDMMFLENGDMLVGQYGAGIVQYGKDGSHKRTYGDAQVETFTVSGNHIYIADSRSNSILIYNGETFDQESSLSFDSFTWQTNIAAGRGGAVYIYNSNGVFRLLPEGSMFEKIIDGDLTSLSMPNNSLQGFIETEDGEFFIFSSDSTGSKIFRYTYNPDIATRPDNELVVFTLYDNRTLRQAAGIFQKTHPDTRINIQVGMGDDGATVSDIIRTLNTEIMANKGPDIIMLDGLNADNYIDKGVLLDVADLIKEEAKKEQMIESVLKSFEKDGKIYAVPAKFSMPLIFADAVNKDAMQDINTLAEFAAANPNTGIIGNKTAENLLKVFLPGSMPVFLDGKEINEQNLAEYLNAVKKMADTPAPVLTMPDEMRQGAENVMIRRGGPGYRIGESNPDDVFNFAFENVHTFVSRLTGFRSLMPANMAAEQRGDCAALPLPGLVSNVFIPSAIVGINAQSENADIARDFLKTMLSKDIQSVRLGDGFAVNISALEDTMETENNMFISMAGQSATGQTLSGGVPSIENQKKIMDLCLEAKTPYFANDTLAEMIIDEAKGYFSGEKDINKTIADIRERTRIYLAE